MRSRMVLPKAGHRRADQPPSVDRSSAQLPRIDADEATWIAMPLPQMRTDATGQARTESTWSRPAVPRNDAGRVVVTSPATLQSPRPRWHGDRRSASRPAGSRELSSETRIHAYKPGHQPPAPLRPRAVNLGVLPAPRWAIRGGVTRTRASRMRPFTAIARFGLTGSAG
jgi:hypothetical protein